MGLVDPSVDVVLRTSNLCTRLPERLFDALDDTPSFARSFRPLLAALVGGPPARSRSAAGGLPRNRGATSLRGVVR
ncbi:hypothetical protein AERO9AM_10982 [Aeromicrobium sp. 9AM]|nr:hypothetical protein AERO9AM_10982 [Aeromicrobium sp. 9AM]